VPNRLLRRPLRASNHNWARRRRWAGSSSEEEEEEEEEEELCTSITNSIPMLTTHPYDDSCIVADGWYQPYLLPVFPVAQEIKDLTKREGEQKKAATKKRAEVEKK